MHSSCRSFCSGPLLSSIISGGGVSAAEVCGLRPVQCLACLPQISSKSRIFIVSGLHAATVHELHHTKCLARLQRCMS